MSSGTPQTPRFRPADVMTFAGLFLSWVIPLAVWYGTLRNVPIAIKELRVAAEGLKLDVEVLKQQQAAITQIHTQIQILRDRVEANQLELSSRAWIVRAAERGELHVQPPAH